MSGSAQGTRAHNTRRLALVENFRRGLLIAVSAALGIAVVVLSVLSLVLFPIWVLVLRAPVGLQFARELAEAERDWAMQWFGIRIPGDYRRWPAQRSNDSRSSLRAALAALADPQHWRDLGWVVVNIPVGILLGGVSGGLAIDGALGVFVAPWVWLFSSGHDLFWALCFPVGVVFLMLSPLVSPPLQRAHVAFSRALLSPGRSAMAQRVEQLTDSRGRLADDSTAELRRIERDLHDGPQVRLAALGLNIGLAERIVRDDPEAASALLAEAREASVQALEELRGLVRGILPPVLAERGLGPAVAALSLRLPIPIDLEIQLSQRLPAPTESAMYFAVAEALANVVKHSGASRGSVQLRYERSRLIACVSDDGIGGADRVVDATSAVAGGADLVSGGGLAGIRRRLAAFDGTMTVSSPPGGPTDVMLEIPCELSSAKTTPFSGTA